MKPVLYAQHETAFDTNGIGVLTDIIECRVVQYLNGQYELTMKYPRSGIHYKDIVKQAIILAKPDPVNRTQPFRIYRRVPSSNGTITVYARHIAYDMMGIIVSPFSAVGIQSALPAIQDNAVNECPFNFWTDKTTGAAFSVTVPNKVWSLLGGSEGSILDVYGGEYEFDRFDVKLWNRRGEDRGVSIRYGKNLTSLEQDENISNCYTGVYPYWVSSEGELVQLEEKIVNATGTYDHVRLMPLDLSQEWEEAPTEDQLRERAERYIKENDIGTPDVSWKVEFVALEQTEEYKGMDLLERVVLGDTVSVEFPDMDISASARAVSYDFDVLLERYDSISLGKVKANITDTIVQQQKEIEKKPSQTLVQSLVMTLTATILGAKGGAVRLLDTNGDGLPDTLYVADDPDPDKALKVWRWNYEGWAGSKTGYNGPFVVGATLEDGILASAVTAANLVAGTIQSKDGESFFVDLDNGIVNIKAISDLDEKVDQNAESTSQKISSAVMNSETIIFSALEEYAKSADLETLKESISAELSVMADKVAISVSETVEQKITDGDNELLAMYNELRMNYDFGADGQYIGKKDSDTMLRLVNDMMQILVAGVAATTVDKSGLTAEQANIKTLHMGEYTLALGNDGHLMLT